MKSNPTNFTDPMGELPVPVITGIVGGVVGLVGGYINSSSCSISGKLKDTLFSGVVGFAGGFFAGVGFNTAGLASTLGGLAVDAGINAIGVFGDPNGGPGGGSSGSMCPKKCKD